MSKMSEEESNVTTAIGCLVTLITFPFITAYSGFALSYLWLWFFVPLGLMPIGMCHALGIATLIGLYGNNDYNGKKDETNTGLALFRFIIARTTHITFALVFGYIWHHFMNN
jgi:hypothetical protein